MKAEAEAKVELPCEELGRLRGLLRAEADAVEEAVEVDTYYQHPCRDFASTDEALRLRLAGRRAELTYKGPRRVVGGVKSRPEVTVELADAEGARRLLAALGFREVAVVRKRREYYRLGRLGVTVTLDVVEGLGCFVEVEASEGAADPVAVVERALRELGLASRPRVTRSYLELLLERLGRAGKTSGAG